MRKISDSARIVAQQIQASPETLTTKTQKLTKGQRLCASVVNKEGMTRQQERAASKMELPWSYRKKEARHARHA
ncbi:MAG: hypothetical protein OXI62_09905, partial [Chloroflexota bacterium]|nr:hypothetical protein [Chloroflexota bacterium]